MLNGSEHVVVSAFRLRKKRAKDLIILSCHVWPSNHRADKNNIRSKKTLDKNSLSLAVNTCRRASLIHAGHCMQ